MSAERLPHERDRLPARGLRRDLGSLDEACDVFLFYGLTLSERIEVADGMVLLPYGDLLRFVDREIVRDFAPSGAGFHGRRAVGAVARPFRRRPELP